jgi:hypothetical protein
VQNNKKINKNIDELHANVFVLIKKANWL